MDIKEVLNILQIVFTLLILPSLRFIWKLNTEIEVMNKRFDMIEHELKNLKEMIEDVKDEHKDFKDDIKELWRNVK
jgi:predicted  nucleic acid-binding Zn-ribbon protein